MTNPERDQDRAEDLIDTWRKYGYVMFPQQRRIYEQLANEVQGRVLEAGCGGGHGSAVIDRRLSLDDAGHLVATDKSMRNVRFARCLYPWIGFYPWDIQEPLVGHGRFDCVVAVEVIEHVTDARVALANLIAAATKEVWISTPNGTGKPRPPSNPFHVQEFTPREMLEMIEVAAPAATVDILGWEDFQRVDLETKTDPLVYKVILR